VGDGNWAFGYNAGPTTGTLTNAGAIGYLARVSQSNSLVLGGLGGSAVQVGIGTPAPAARLHVYGSGPTILRVQSSDAFGTAGLDFWSDPQASANEWRPVALRSTDAGNFTGQLVFYTNGTGFANRQAGVEQMRLVNGGLAIGTTAVGVYRLNVNGAVGATGGFVTTSDQRLKTDIRPLTGALALVQGLHCRRYRWNALGVAHGGTAGREQLGLLAQELAQVLPELVSTGPDGYQAVNYSQLAPVLIEAIKELKTECDAAQARADRAEATTAAFERRLRALEAGGARAQASH
jgi:Chaperone of endosialidase